MAYEEAVLTIMQQHDVPGAAIAIVRDDRLVYSRGFGYADKQEREVVQPSSVFRIASVSKPITAAAVLRLYEDGRLDLDAKVFGPPPTGIGLRGGSTTDSRWSEVTVRDLLRHTGGFDSALSGDPQWHDMQLEVSRATSKPAPLTCSDIIAFLRQRPLDFSPGERYAYSNFGYCVLGRVIEAASGVSYEDYVRQAVLEPAGAGNMRLADPFRSDHEGGEVYYYDYPGASRGRLLGADDPRTAPWPYTGFLSTMDSHGGWASSAVDLVRFLLAVDGRGSDVLAASTVEEMVSPQRFPPFDVGMTWYGLGWFVQDVEGERRWFHGGAIPGAAALLVRADSRTGWGVLMNSLPEDWQAFQQDVDEALWEAFERVEVWPGHDLFLVER